MKPSKIGIVFGIAVILAASAYLGATAYVNSKIDAQISVLRDGEISRLSQGIFGASDMRLSSGFFTRRGTLNLIVSPPGQNAFSVPVSFTIQQYPSLLSPARAHFTVGRPVSGALHDVMAALGSTQFMQGDYSQEWSGGNALSMRLDPLRGIYRDIDVDWGGGTVDVHAKTRSGEAKWNSTSHIDPITLGNAARGTRVKIGAMSIVYEIDADVTEHSGKQSYDFKIAPSDVISGGKTQYAMRDADLHVSTNWNLGTTQDAEFDLKRADLSVSMQKPTGDVDFHADGFIPVTEQEVKSIQSDPSLVVSMLGRVVAHASLTAPKALIAQIPNVQSLAEQYGTADGQNIRLDAVFQSGHLLIGGKPAF